MSDTLTLAPMLPWPVIAGLSAAALGLVVLALVRGGRGTVLRAVVLAVLVVALVNPRAVHEERQPQNDIAIVVVDRSASQSVGKRREQTAAALASVTLGLARFDDLEVRVIEATDGAGDRGTRLFGALSRAALEVPRQRFAGTIMITDGQIHDVPATAPVPGPVHVLLTGRPSEYDRHLVVEQAPSYGIVGQEVTIRYRVEDRRAEKARGFASNLARVRLRYDGNQTLDALVPVGRSATFTFKLDHAGLTVVELEVDAAEGELSTVNNRALVSINGVRDRLRVLLVSGQPHAGERTWRNLLKSDPSVDLIHFTILRPPEKDDFTPLKELALIAFPVQELFETKLADFDLIVFDRYVIRDVLPPSYLRNIVDFIHGGGAMLLALGPEFASIRSLYQTPLGKVIPAMPTGKVLEGGFKPSITDIGRRHPVTARLPQEGAGTPEWGRWFRLIDAVPKTGRVLMRGAGDKPLLLLDRMGKGRVAQLLSDHIWLWARGFEGGGPDGELLRRLAHWLMKEPDLEEEGLKAEIHDGRLRITRNSLEATLPEITVTRPSGKTVTLDLKAGDGGAAQGTIEATEPGLYRVSDGTQTALAAAGALNPLELSDLRASADKVRAVTEASGGGIVWIADGMPEFRRTRPGRDSAGRGWIGLVANKSFVVSGLAQVPLLPDFLVLILVLGGLMSAWYREGR
ncbi:MAG: hypothetical protein IIC56_07335 [Proteobacteria bacterium]|nr:hypothetical protein [Pseudomonadota bacterium]